MKNGLTTCLNLQRFNTVKIRKAGNFERLGPLTFVKHVKYQLNDAQLWRMVTTLNS
jgi:hypothetical protein